MSQQNSFTSSSTPGPTNRLVGGPGLGGKGVYQHRVAQEDVPRAASLPRSVPTLTIYPDGFVNLNAEASGLVSGFPGFCLRAPPAVRAGRTPQLWELGEGECYDASPRRDKQQVRFRADADHAPPAGVYALLPVAGAPKRFSLLPI